MPDAEVKRQLFEKGGQLFRRESGATAIGVNTREQVATARLVTRFAASALAWAVVCSACNRSSENSRRPNLGATWKRRCRRCNCRRCVLPQRKHSGDGAATIIPRRLRRA